MCVKRQRDSVRVIIIASYRVIKDKLMIDSKRNMWKKKNRKKSKKKKYINTTKEIECEKDDSEMGRERGEKGRTNIGKAI